MTVSDHQSSDAGIPSSERLAELALGLAEQAGRLMLQQRAKGFSIGTKSTVTDVVTDADHAVERFLVSELARLRPDDSVLGEEGGQVSDSVSGIRWLIDPIDGTVNFMLGLPHFAVSIAAEVYGQVVAGCVHNPVAGTFFHAALGSGAYLDEKLLTGPRSVPVEEAVVATGFGYDQAQRARQGAVVGRLLPRIGNLRRVGSAALDLCGLAAGWVDMYYEGPLGEWDFAAAALIAAEAGVTLSGLGGRPPGPWMVAGAHPDHAEQFFDLLVEVGADAG
jgi:myo-inositol-1(or 4)-monophosphatase